MTKKERKRLHAAKRGDWGNIKPVTRIIPDKRRKPPKHKEEGVES